MSAEVLERLALAYELALKLGLVRPDDDAEAFEAAMERLEREARRAAKV